MAKPWGSREMPQVYCGCTSFVRCQLAFICFYECSHPLTLPSFRDLQLTCPVRYPHLSPHNIRPASAYRCSIDTTCRQYHYAFLEKLSSIWCFLCVVWIKGRNVAAWIKYGVSINRSFTLMITTKTDRNLEQEQGESLVRSNGWWQTVVTSLWEQLLWTCGCRQRVTWCDMVWYDIFVNCSWVDTWWQ